MFCGHTWFKWSSKKEFVKSKYDKTSESNVTTCNIWSFLPFYLCSDNSGSFTGIWRPAGLAPPSALRAAALALVLEVIWTRQRRADERLSSSWSGTKWKSGAAAPRLDLMRWAIPERPWPSSPRYECPAAASCTWSWPLSIRWYLEPHDLPSDGTSVDSDFLPSDAPGHNKPWRIGSKGGSSKAAFTHWWKRPEVFHLNWSTTNLFSLLKLLFNFSQHFLPSLNLFAQLFVLRCGILQFLLSHVHVYSTQLSDLLHVGKMIWCVPLPHNPWVTLCTARTCCTFRPSARSSSRDVSLFCSPQSRWISWKIRLMENIQGTVCDLARGTTTNNPATFTV